jgi:hypothetical protein
MDIGVVKTEVEFVERGGELLFPSILPFGKLKINRAMMGVSLFSSQYLLETLPSESAMFDVGKIMIVDPSGIPSELRRWIFVDPCGDPIDNGSARKRDGDNCAIAVLGVAGTGHVYLLDGVSDRLTETEAMEAIAFYCKTFAISCIGIERTGLGNLRNHLMEHFRRTGVFHLTEDIKPKGKSKFSRISDLLPFIDLGYFRISSEAGNREQFLWELARVKRDGTLPAKDDTIDAVSYFPEFLAKYGAPQGCGDEDIEAELWRLSNGDQRHFEFWKSQKLGRKTGEVVGVGDWFGGR